MGVSFTERYYSDKTWQGRVMVMEIFHLAAISSDRNWTVGKTASFFGVSIGLASENLRLADAIHRNEKLLECKTRQEALRKL